MPLMSYAWTIYFTHQSVETRFGQILMEKENEQVLRCRDEQNHTTKYVAIYYRNLGSKKKVLLFILMLLQTRVFITMQEKKYFNRRQ